MARLGRSQPYAPIVKRFAVTLFGPQNLVGTSASSTWNVAALALTASAVALSGTSASSTWTVASIELAPSSLALSGTSAASTWNVAAIDAVASGAGALSGTSASATWNGASIQLAPGSVALSGTSAAATWNVPALALVGPSSGFDDLNWLFSRYLPDLALLHAGADDITTQLHNDEATMLSGNANADDRNTAYVTYLTPKY